MTEEWCQQSTCFSGLWLVPSAFSHVGQLLPDCTSPQQCSVNDESTSYNMQSTRTHILLFGRPSKFYILAMYVQKLDMYRKFLKKIWFFWDIFDIFESTMIFSNPAVVNVVCRYWKWHSAVSIYVSRLTALMTTISWCCVAGHCSRLTAPSSPRCSWLFCPRFTLCHVHSNNSSLWLRITSVKLASFDKEFLFIFT